MLESIVIAERTRRSLLDYTKAGCPFHLIFIGEAHIGKRTLAECMAKHCLEVKNLDASMDFIRLEAKEGLIGIEDMRSLLQQIRVYPQNGKRRVILIDGAHKMSVPAQNALLKVLEDGSESNLFFLVTEETLLPTVTSRCRTISVFPDKSMDMKYDVLNRVVRGRQGVRRLYEGSEFFSELIALEAVLQNAAERKELLSLIGGLKEKDKAFYWDRFSQEELEMFLSYMEDIFLSAYLSLEIGERSCPEKITQQFRKWYGKDRLPELAENTAGLLELLRKKKASRNDFLQWIFEIVA